MKERVILLSIPYTMSARNILSSDIFRCLKDNFKVVILTPLYADENFRKEFSSTNVIIKELPRDFSFCFKVFRRVLDIVEGCHFTARTKIDTLIILGEALKKTNPIIYWSRRVIGLILAPLLGFMRRCQARKLRSSYFYGLFKEYDPSLVFLTHPIALEEFPLAFSAKARGIPVVAMIHSWDNITSKSGMRTVTSNRSGRMLPLNFDKVIVWNNIMRQELVDYYGYNAEDIFATGVPQFDFYRNYNASSRDEFFKKIGADPEKKLILYAAGSEFLLPKQAEVIEILVNAVKDNLFDKPAQILVRFHPGSNMNLLKDKFANTSDVFFDEPGIANAALRYSKGWGASDDTQTVLADLLTHSDVTVNVSSTMSLDAAVLDRPIVCIGLDGYKNLPYHKSLLKHYDFTHYAHVMRTGGVKLAKSPEELITYINNYLLDPSLDKDGRRRIREELCFNSDGKAGERIAGFISDFVEQLDR